ncbi:MAG: hypothetical protein ACI381_04610 [Candidatus Methanomethylophilaceae archaeon]
MSWREPILDWKSSQMTMGEIKSFIESKKAEYPDCDVIFDGDSGCILLEHPGLEGY